MFETRLDLDAIKAQRLMGAQAQEELRRAAYPVAEAIADGYAMDPGLAEMIQRLAYVLDYTNGWRPEPA